MATAKSTVLDPWIQIPISGPALLRNHAAAVLERVPYVWGGKPGADLTPDELTGADCSGYVGWLVARACLPYKVRWTGRGTSWFAAMLLKAGVKRSSVEAATRKDGIVRCAVAVAGGGIGSIGHICLILDGVTYECVGSRGVCSRAWTGKGWQRFALVFCLAQLPTTRAGGIK